MAVTFTFYNAFKTRQLNGNAIDLDTDTLKLALTTSSYTPNADTHDFFDDITNQVTSSGYSAGGATLTTPTVTQDNTGDLAKFDADDVTWSAVTLTTRYGVLYKSTGTASTSGLIGYYDWGGDQTLAGADFTVVFNASGIITLT